MPFSRRRSSAVLKRTPNPIAIGNSRRFERDGAARDLERGLFHYAVAVRLYEEQGREEEAVPCRMRRGSLARVLSPQTAVRIAYEAMDWRPSGLADE